MRSPGDNVPTTYHSPLQSSFWSRDSKIPRPTPQNLAYDCKNAPHVHGHAVGYKSQTCPMSVEERRRERYADRIRTTHHACHRPARVCAVSLSSGAQRHAPDTNHSAQEATVDFNASSPRTPAKDGACVERGRAREPEEFELRHSLLKIRGSNKGTFSQLSRRE